MVIPLSGAMAYHKGIRQTADAYREVLSRSRQLNEDDHVLLPIARTDRSNTEPKNLEARVVETSGGRVKLGTAAGKIDVTFRQEQLVKVNGRKRSFDVPDGSVSLIKAMRFESSYSTTSSASLCACRGTCLTKRCPCRKGGVDCATKCHNGKTCDTCLNRAHASR